MRDERHVHAHVRVCKEEMQRQKNQCRKTNEPDVKGFGVDDLYLGTVVLVDIALVHAEVGTGKGYSLVIHLVQLFAISQVDALQATKR